MYTRLIQSRIFAFSCTSACEPRSNRRRTVGPQRCLLWVVAPSTPESSAWMRYTRHPRPNWRRKAVCDHRQGALGTPTGWRALRAGSVHSDRVTAQPVEGTRCQVPSLSRGATPALGNLRASQVASHARAAYLLPATFSTSSADQRDSEIPLMRWWNSRLGGSTQTQQTARCDGRRRCGVTRDARQAERPPKVRSVDGEAWVGQNSVVGCWRPLTASHCTCRRRMCRSR